MLNLLIIMLFKKYSLSLLANKISKLYIITNITYGMLIETHYLGTFIFICLKTINKMKNDIIY